MINPLIAPTTNVRLLGDIPLDNTYTDTIKFTDASSQSAYFLGKTKLSFNNLTYQRLTPNNPQWALFLECSADQVYDCNYIMYQNAGFSSKWFYAFIVEILYVSENCTAITFEIDVMQTWLFDFEIKRSFIERMHVTDDRLGRNVLAENLEYGPRYFVRRMQPGSALWAGDDEVTTPNTDNYVILVSCTEDCDVSDFVVEGRKYAGIYQGLKYIAFGDVSTCNDWLKRMNQEGKAGAICQITMLPSVMLPGVQAGASGKIEVTGDTPTINSLYDDVQIWVTDIMGYVPKNNKLFMYPYNYLEVQTMDGGVYTFKWEDFDGYEDKVANGGAGTVRFRYRADFNNNPTILCYPDGYLTRTNNYEYAMRLSGWPQCSWKYGNFENWLAQNDLSMGLNFIGGMLGMGASASNAPSAGTSGAAGGAVALGAAQAGLSSFATVSSEYARPDTVRGASNPGGQNVAFGIQNFWFVSKYIHWGYAQKIDDYLWKFGYRVCATGVPPLSRPYWDYLKMQRPSVVGNIPVNDMRKIKEILSNGITFWHTTDVGNYSLNNNEGVPGH